MRLAWYQSVVGVNIPRIEALRTHTVNSHAPSSRSNALINGEADVVCEISFPTLHHVNGHMILCRHIMLGFWDYKKEEEDMQERE